jgi:predicted secreted protein
VRVAAAIVVAIALAGCASAPPEPARRAIVGPDFVTLAEQDALIELKRGTRLHVRLESETVVVANRRWHITAVNGTAVEPFGQPWFAAKRVYAVQEPGNWIFDFNAVAPGATTVTFDFRRDNEPLSAAMRTATFDFVVR